MNIILILPIGSVNPYGPSIFRQDDNIITKIGSSYYANSEWISIKTKTGGKYYVDKSKTTLSS